MTFSPDTSAQTYLTAQGPNCTTLEPPYTTMPEKKGHEKI